MKKIILLPVIVILLIIEANAQVLDEWLNQKSTQKKYLLQQIVALHTYIGYAKKGYNIVSSGIHSIRDIKKGELNLHNTFFNSLKNVNPKISRYAKVADIIAYQIRVIKQTKETIKGIRETKQFTNDELNYCIDVFDNLLTECIKTIDELMMVITNGELEMKDDERLKRIDKLYAGMQDKYAFCSSFSDDMALLSMQRLGEQSEINRSKLLNGIK
jgi:hypothetical protein